MTVSVHDSYWHASGDEVRANYAPLRGNLDVDVAIIGGGITGLTAALHLKQAGRQVVVLESGNIGAGTTGFTTAQLDMTTDQPLKQLIDDFGVDVAAAVTSASREAIDEIEQRCLPYEDCEFARVPSYQYTEVGKNPAWISEQLEAGLKLGLPLSKVDVAPLPFYNRGGIRCDQQARLHSQHYLDRLAALVHGDGSAIYEHTRAQPPEDGKPCRIAIEGGTVRAKHVFVATHSAFLGISQWDARVHAYQSYVLGVRVDDTLPDALFWDDAEPYHYLRHASLRNDPDLLLIGGADHKTGQKKHENQCYEELEAYARERFSVKSIDYRWSSEYFEPVDGLPYVGRVPSWEHITMATGYSGTGITLGTVAGKLAADVILNRDNRLIEPLNPGRMSLRASVGTFVSENLNVAYRYVADRFAGPKVDSLAEISAGTGKLVTLNGKQQAVYRDAGGTVHAMSPVCTHAGCIVQWNEAENTWDCPCHGGRYTAEGKCFAGPPRADLSRDV